jgi:hypothetical protein
MKKGTRVNLLNKGKKIGEGVVIEEVPLIIEPRQGEGVVDEIEIELGDDIFDNNWKGLRSLITPQKIPAPAIKINITGARNPEFVTATEYSYKKLRAVILQKIDLHKDLLMTPENEVKLELLLRRVLDADPKVFCVETLPPKLGKLNDIEVYEQTTPEKRITISFNK